MSGAVWPRVGASAAIFRGDEVLLVQRGPGKVMAGRWSLPGGHVEAGEALADAARREVLEETGVTAEVRGRVDLLEPVGRHAAGGVQTHYVIVVHWGVWVAGDAMAASDAADARFVHIGAIGAYDLTAGAAALIQRAHALFRQ
jgi:8-oxo-dGTP diphosphatase